MSQGLVLRISSLTFCLFNLYFQVREDIVKDWNHIHETVLSLGVPELADIVGGQLFAGAHSR